MIDFEYQIYTHVADKVQSVFPDAFVTSQVSEIPAEPLCVSILQQDTSVYQRSLDSEKRVLHNRVMFDVNIYSNKQEGSRDECKEVLRVVHDAFFEINFVMTYSRQLENLLDKSYSRIISRFQAIVRDDGFVYRK